MIGKVMYSNKKREECKYPQGNGVIEMYKRGTIQIRL